MPHSSPEEVFAAARAAMERSDFDGFFGCLDRTDLVRVANNSLRSLQDNERGAADLDDLCTTHDLAPDAMTEARRLTAQVLLSARSMTEARSTEPSGKADLEDQRKRSVHHRDLVKQYDRHLEGVIKSVTDLPGFTAALERLMREVVGGGSVSSTLFVGESLEDVELYGKRAWARRRVTEEWAEDLGFVARKDGWYIRLLARRPPSR